MSDSTVTTLDDESTNATAAAPAKTKAVKAATSAAAKEAGLAGTTKKLTIHNGEGAAGREDVFVGVNGYAFSIKRGQIVEVPAEVVSVLQDAVTTQYENGQEINTPRYAITVHN